MKKGDKYEYGNLMGLCDIEVLRVSAKWADIQVTPRNGLRGWTKRQPLPFPSVFVPVSEKAGEA